MMWSNERNPFTTGLNLTWTSLCYGFFMKHLPTIPIAEPNSSLYPNPVGMNKTTKSFFPTGQAEQYAFLSIKGRCLKSPIVSKILMVWWGGCGGGMRGPDQSLFRNFSD